MGLDGQALRAYTQGTGSANVVGARLSEVAMRKCSLNALVTLAFLTFALWPTMAFADGPLFGAPIDFAPGSSPRSVAIGDLNGDGKLDLTTANYNGDGVSVLLGNGDGTFGAKTDFATGYSPRSVAIADLNGDAKPDLTTANENLGTVSILLGTGHGTFGAKTDFIASGVMGTSIHAWSVAIGDLNGDEKPDLAVATGDWPTVSVLVNRLGSVPVIAAVHDVPNDQGERVFVTWRCPLDQPGQQVVTGYRIWRRVPALAVANATREDSSGESGLEASQSEPTFQQTSTVARDGSVSETFWEAVATLPSAQLVRYGYTAATTQDSMAGSNPYTAFFVQALTAEPFEFYSSAPDSGYSVDNLSPAQPAPFAASYGPDGVTLHWGANTEDDLRGYRLYRSTSPDFTPAPSNLLVAQPDTGFFDPSGSLAFAYKLSAIDVHGNESRFALVTHDGATGALASLLSAEVEGTVVRLRWLAAANPGLMATVYRRTSESAWTALGQVSADGTGIMAWNDAQVSLGQQYGYRLGIWDGASEVFLEAVS